MTNLKLIFAILFFICGLFSMTIILNDARKNGRSVGLWGLLIILFFPLAVLIYYISYLDTMPKATFKKLNVSLLGVLLFFLLFNVVETDTSSTNGSDQPYQKATIVKSEPKSMTTTQNRQQENQSSGLTLTSNIGKFRFITGYENVVVGEQYDKPSQSYAIFLYDIWANTKSDLFKLAGLPPLKGIVMMKNGTALVLFVNGELTSRGDDIYLGLLSYGGMRWLQKTPRAKDSPLMIAPDGEGNALILSQNGTLKLLDSRGNFKQLATDGWSIDNGNVLLKRDRAKYVVVDGNLKYLSDRSSKIYRGHNGEHLLYSQSNLGEIMQVKIELVRGSTTQELVRMNYNYDDAAVALSYFNAVFDRQGNVIWNLLYPGSNAKCSKAKNRCMVLQKFSGTQLDDLVSGESIQLTPVALVEGKAYFITKNQFSLYHVKNGSKPTVVKKLKSGFAGVIYQYKNILLYSSTSGLGDAVMRMQLPDS